MPHQLTQKEQMLLEDLKKHEEVCIHKYQTYGGKVQDPQLKQLLDSYAQQEQQHLDSVNQMLRGEIPPMSSGQQSSTPTMTATAQTQGTGSKQDELLLTDLLMTEKHVSGTYDTAIFEFTNPQMRQALNHIQKEEQQHGEGLFNYMTTHGMYTPK
ncbi:MAG TPA: spore coat protein [bacterium]|nr:spore coat protein [bacterium]